MSDTTRYRSYVCEVERGDILLAYFEHGSVREVVSLPDRSASAVKIVFMDDASVTFRHRDTTVWVLP